MLYKYYYGNLFNAKFYTAEKFTIGGGHVAVHVHILADHVTLSIGRLSPPSGKHPWTTATLESHSFAIVSLLFDLILLRRPFKAAYFSCG